MRKAAAQLMARDQTGRDFFVRGLPEKYHMVRRVTYTASLLDLMQGYARVRTRDQFHPFVMDRKNVFTMEEALDNMRHLIRFAGEWTDLKNYIPKEWRLEPKRRRAATAAHFAASLELAKSGHLELRQLETFGRIDLKRKKSG